jgi:hypothetical protein
LAARNSLPSRIEIVAGMRLQRLRGPLLRTVSVSHFNSKQTSACIQLDVSDQGPLTSSEESTTTASRLFHKYDNLEGWFMATKTNGKRKRVAWTKEDVRDLKTHSKSKTPVAKISKVMKRTEGAIRQKALVLDISIGHRR